VAGETGLGIWTVGNATMTKLPTMPEGTIRAVAFSSTMNWLAAAGDDQKIFIWDWRNGRLSATMDPSDRLHFSSAPIVSVAWSSDGARLAAAQSDGVVRLWDVSDLK
jgi:WD40 repeat protein